MATRRGPQFLDRREAGRHLVPELAPYADLADGLVLGLPRGGVPVAAEVASSLHLPLDVYLVRKLGVPGHEELALGALAADGSYVFNNEIVANTGLDQYEIDPIIARERQELERRNRLYREGCPDLDVSGKTVILVDDGLATGATMKAAVRAIRMKRPRMLVVAVPVGAPETCDEIAVLVDQLVCPYRPSPFLGVGRWYINFDQVNDDEVLNILKGVRDSSSRPSSTTQ